MATPLQDFRRQYPEYNDLSDEELAENLRTKYYSDMEPREYRRKIGLRAIEPNRPEPTVSERINSRLNQDARELDPLKTPPEARRRQYQDPDGFEIDVDRPTIFNDDGSASTESTIGVNLDGREYNIPSIVNGERVSNEAAVEDARAKMAEGWQFPNYDTIEEAEEAAGRRSDAIGGVRAQAARDRDIDPLMSMALDPDSELSTWFRDKAENAEKGLLNNSLRLAGERGSNLLGNAIQGIGRMGDYYGDYYGSGQIVFGTDWGPEDPADGKFRVRYMDAQEFDQFEQNNDVRNILTDTVPEYFMSADFGGMERHTVEAIKYQYNQGNIFGTIGSVLTFGLEQGITSIPDMIAVMGGPASISLYVNARSNEMGTTRAENKGLDGDDAGFLENLEALPFAIGSALLERIGAKGIVGAFGEKTAEQVGKELLEAGLAAAAKRVAAAGGVAAAKEAATEFFQEGVLEYLAENLGTEAPLSWEDALERGFFGALGGATFGGGAGGLVATAGEVVRAGDLKLIADMEEAFAKKEAEPEPGEIDPEPEGPPPDTDFDEEGNIIEVEPEPGVDIEPESGAELVQKLATVMETMRTLSEGQDSDAFKNARADAEAILVRMEMEIGSMPAGEQREQAFRAYQQISDALDNIPRPGTAPEVEPEPEPEPEIEAAPEVVPESNTELIESTVAMLDDIPLEVFADPDNEVQNIIKVPSEDWISDNEAVHQASLEAFQADAAAAGWELVGEAKNGRSFAYLVPALKGDAPGPVELYKAGGGLGWNLQIRPPDADWTRATGGKKPTTTPAEPAPGPPDATTEIEAGDTDVDVTQQPTPNPEPEIEVTAEYFDVRLKRDEYRIRVADLGNELVPGGGITLVPAPEGEYGYVGRTPSVNPQWFQEMNQVPETRMSVKQVQNAVNKAVTGQTLGVRQQRVIQHMLNEVQGQREDPSNIDYAQEQLREAREARTRARRAAADKLNQDLTPDPDEDLAGELFEEGEYLPEMTAEARIVDELADKLDDYGEDVSERVAVILDRSANTGEAMQALEELLHEQQTAAPGATGAELTQEPEQAAEAETTPRLGRKKLTAIQQDGLTKARQLGDVFEANAFLALPTIASGKPGTAAAPGDLTAGPGQSTMTVNTLTGLVSKGYLQTVDVRGAIGEHTFRIAPDPVQASRLPPPASREMVTLRERQADRQARRDLVTRSPDTIKAELGALAADLEMLDQGETPAAYGSNFEAIRDDQIPDMINTVKAHISREITELREELQQLEEGRPGVEQQRGPYNADQLELYLEQPVETQADAPGLRPAQIAAVAAVENISAIPGVLAEASSRDLATQQRTPLIGQTIESLEDLAVLAQIYRDPRFETLRTIFVNDAGEVVAQVGLTSRMPASAPGSGEAELTPFLEKLHAAATAQGATGYYMVHNHPSGQSMPSNADENITRAYAERMPGFKGHVVVDTNNYSTITQGLGYPQGMGGGVAGQPPALQLVMESDRFEFDFGAQEEIFVDPVGRNISNPGDIRGVIRELQIVEQGVTLIHLTQRHQVVGISTLSPTELTADPRANRRALMRASLGHRAARVVAVARSEGPLRAVSEWTMDSILLNEDGSMDSAAETGVGQGDPIPARFLPRISPDTSQAFDYLRESTLQDRLDYPQPGGRTTTRVREGSPFADALERALRRFEMEQQGQSILDDMEENEISPHVASEIFWTETYYQLTGDMQLRFQRMLKGLGYEPGYVSMVRPDGTTETLADWFEVADFVKNGLAQDAIDLEGTERGYVALMQWANQQMRDQEPEFELEQQPVLTAPTAPVPPPAPVDISPDLGIVGDLFSVEANQQMDLVDESRRKAREEGTEEERRRYGDERRLDPSTRARYEQMSTDEFIDLILTDELTGVGNRRAFNDMLPHAQAVASIDVDGLGPINDNISHSLGDALLQAVANALDKTGAEVYHTSGDEFYILGDSEQDIAAMIDKAKIDLAHQVLEDQHGRVTGIFFTHGLGADKANADRAMELSKKKRERNGTRQAKGVMPIGAVMFSSRAETLAISSGSNNVAHLGKHGQLPTDPDGNYVLGNGDIVVIPKKPVRRRHVIKYLERKFGVKIYQGRVKGQTRLGFYRPGHGEIRVKYHNDLEVTAHELAHWLDDRHPWISNLYKAYREEILQVSYDDKLDFEGYAEFMRTWFTQDHEAQRSAPGFYDAWMEALEAHPGLKTVALDLQQMMHGWYLQGARARLQSRFGGSISFTDRVRDIFAKWQDKWLQRVLDGLRPFKEIERQIRGSVSTAAYSGYKSLRLARGAHGIMQGIFHRGTVNWDENGDLVFTGIGLKAIFDKTNDRHENQLAYLVARRAQELRSQNRENLIRDDEIQAGLKLGREDPELVQVFDEWQAFNDRMMDFYESSGILSAQSRAAIQEMNKSYVPFNRIMDTMMGERVKRGGGTPFMRLKGGTQDIADIMESIVGNTSHLVHMSLVNMGKRNFYRMIDGTDNQTAGMYAAKVGKEVRPTHVRSDQVVKAMVEAFGLDMKWFNALDSTGMYTSEAELELFNTIKTMADGLEPMVMFWQFGQDPRGDIDYYFEAGEKKFYEIIDARLWEAIQQIGPQQHNLAVNILGGFANVLRRGVTLTPTFQAKNFIRDTMNAFTLSRGHIVPAASATKALLERVYNNEHYWEYMINGGGFASMADADGINRDRVLDTHKKVWDHLDSALSAFEYANRIAEFKVLKEKGWTAREAALAGREISTDFAMRGSSEFINVLTISVPFLNARMQGLYRNGRELMSLEEGRVQFAGKQAFSYALRSMIAITIPTLALFMLNKDDERYQEMPDWIKDLSWILFTGPGEDDYVMLPKPFETGMLWGTLPERMIGYYYDHDEKELADAMLWMMMETFNLNPIPQAFKPWYELQKNQNFTGAPIIPDYLKTVEPSEQYKAYTSDAMIALGRKLNISPLKAEHLVRGHLGTMGTWALGMADMLVGDVANGGNEPTKGIKENILLSPFVNDGPLRRTHSENHLYEMLQETQQVVNTVRLMTRRSPDRIEEYISDPRKELLYTLNKDLSDWSRDMRELQVGIDVLQADPEMTGDAKREAIHELQRARNDIAREVYKNINPEMVQRLLEEIDNQLIRARVAGAQ